MCLVKVTTPMNLTGAGLRRLLEHLAFDPSHLAQLGQPGFAGLGLRQRGLLPVHPDWL
jgi:hypothetical protein